MTEKEMRESKVPFFETLEELVDYITSLKDMEHDYGTAAYAMSMAATATFNYMASELGTTGFQASCADLDVLRRTRQIKGPMMLIDADRALYPQYNILNDVCKFLKSNEDWMASEAKKRLEENRDACEKVQEHWRKLAK